MKQSGLLSGLFLYGFFNGLGNPSRLYINDAAVPIPEIHKETSYNGEHSGNRTEMRGYGYAFVSKGDVLSFKAPTYYGLQLSCNGGNSTLAFVPTRRK